VLLTALVVTAGIAAAEPFALPTYDGSAGIKAPINTPHPQKAALDVRSLWRRVGDCYPAKSYFRPELVLQSRLSSAKGSYVDDNGQTTANNRASVSLVLSVPLYSSKELDTEREREYRRRITVADNVATLAETRAKIQVARRELDLIRALEQRAQARVKIGVAETAEQVKYLTRVVELENELVLQQAKLQNAQLQLEAHCENGSAVKAVYEVD
jgi:hypothetical protein